MQTTMLTTTTTADCGCGYGGHPGGATTCDDPVGLERTRFFARQLVGPDDLTQDQRYFREKHRRHNRLLHGWGIVCGACVTAGDDPGTVVVTQGYVLGPYGDEIVIDRDVTVDLLTQDPNGAAVDPCAAVDPWCTEIRADRRGRALWLVVRYAECDTRPVAVSACGCGCEDDDCAYTRTRDSFELRVLDELPDGSPGSGRREPIPGMYSGRAASEPMVSEGMLEGLEGSFLGLAGALSCTGRGRVRCPPCPTSPWVVLARVGVTSSGDVEVVPDPFRRYVASFGAFSFTCDGRKPTDTSGSGKRVAIYLDTARDADAPPPAATVAARTADNRWLLVPGTFTIDPKGETLGDVIAREGARTLVDPQTGDGVRLDELYAAAGAEPATEVTSVADALAPLEGARLDVGGLRVVRNQLDGLIDGHGLQRLQSAAAGSPGAAAEIPATALRGVGTESVVGKSIAGLSVAQVAEQTRAQFVAAATRGLRGAERSTVAEQAQATWHAAARVTKLASAWSVSR